MGNARVRGKRRRRVGERACEWETKKEEEGKRD
jgi:hypothetical protein